jgi:hypothetical protein
MRTVEVRTRDPATGRIMCRTQDKLAVRFAGCRSEAGRIWGSLVLRSLGLWWMPQLDGRRLAVPVEPLAAFREECVLTLIVAESLAVEARCEESDVQKALLNFPRSTDEAESVGGRVEIGKSVATRARGSNAAEPCAEAELGAVRPPEMRHG